MFPFPKNCFGSLKYKPLFQITDPIVLFSEFISTYSVQKKKKRLFLFSLLLYKLSIYFRKIYKLEVYRMMHSFLISK